MKSLQVSIKTLTKNFNQDFIITIPLKLFNKCSNVLKGKIKVGMTECNTIFLPNCKLRTLELSKPLMDKLGFMDGDEYNVILNDNVLCIGPVIAVFTSNGTVRKANIGKPNFKIRELMKANEKGKCIVYCFSIKDVDFINHKINGTYFNKRTLSWEKKTFPFPDVLYDRGGGTLKKQKIISSYIRQQFDKIEGIQKVNPCYYFDKWEMHKKLLSHEEMTPYLPKTIIFKNEKDLRNMLDKFSTVYIKDRRGSNGRGIMRVAKLSNDTFECSYFKKNIIHTRIKTYKELISNIKSFFKNKNLIIQSAINFIKINNRLVDMRATIQRNGKGEVEISACPVRMGCLNSPITSTRSGAKVYKFEDFFTKFLEWDIDEINSIKEKVNNFLNTTFKCIEKSYGIFGEIGIDFGIDTEGRIWFIECNAKPGKDTIYLSYDKNVIEKAFLNPIEYSKYLAGF